LTVDRAIVDGPGYAEAAGTRRAQMATAEIHPNN